MLRTMLKSKIHRATVTQADPTEAGSVTVDPVLMDAADLVPGERVSIVTEGGPFDTYVVEGERGSGVLGVNGVRTGDTVVLVSYGQMDAAEAAAHRPRVVRVDEHNRIVGEGAEPARSTEPVEPAETADAAMLDALLQPES